MPGSAASFQPTRWSLVLRSQGQDARADRALAELCQAYWFPLYAWARRFGIAAADAEDHVQGFFVHVITKRLFAEADPSLGRLRSFLLTAFRRYVQDVHRKEHAQRRGGGTQTISFDAAEAEEWYEKECLADESADHMFDRQWALTVLDRAMERLEAHAESRGKGDEFRVLRPLISEEPSEAKVQHAAKALGMTENACRVAQHRLRGRFRDALRAEIAETQPEGASVDDEMAYLFQVLNDC